LFTIAPVLLNCAGRIRDPSSCYTRSTYFSRCWKSYLFLELFITLLCVIYKNVLTVYIHVICYFWY